MRINTSESTRSLIIGLIILILSNGLFAQSLKKTFKYIEDGEIEKANLETGKFTEEIKKSGVDFTLYGIASCLITMNEKYYNYNPYKSLEMFDITSNISADKMEVDKFLEKYNLSIEKVHDMIYQSILKEAKKINTEESYQKALDVCQECFFKAEVTKLKEEAAYSKTKGDNSILTCEKFIHSYPNSQYLNEIKRLSERLAFEYAKINMSLVSLDNYINKYSNSDNTFIPIVIHLRDSIAFSKLTKSYYDYRDFSNLYPNSEYTSKIKDELPDLLYNQALKENSIKLFEVLVYVYPNNTKTSYAKIQLEKLYYEKLIISRSPEEFALFKRKFPNSSYLQELEANIEGDYEYFTDNRDGKTYKTIRLGNQVWMAENLRFDRVEHAPIPVKIHDVGYNQVSINDYTKIYGEAYEPKIAQNVCPAGWHLPSKYEWEEMFLHVSKNASKESNDETRLTYWYGIADYLMNRKEFPWFFSEHNFQSKFNVLATGDRTVSNYDFLSSAEVVLNKGLVSNYWTSTIGARNYLAVSFYLNSSRDGNGHQLPLVVIHDESTLGDTQFIRCVKNK